MPTADAGLLAKMMALDTHEESLWNPDDLGDVLEHQLNTALEADLAGLRPGLRGRLAELNAADGPRITTFRDLFVHPRPPLELLELTKQFAKRCRSNRDAPLPEDIATVLYLAAIVAAITCLGARITKLSNEGMRHGLAWALRQTWLDETIRALLERGVEAFTGPGSIGP